MISLSSEELTLAISEVGNYVREHIPEALEKVKEVIASSLVSVISRDGLCALARHFARGIDSYHQASACAGMRLSNLESAIMKDDVYVAGGWPPAITLFKRPIRKIYVSFRSTRDVVTAE